MVLLKSVHQRKETASIGSPQHGFTILETLISITIFSLFLLFFLASFTQIFASQDFSWKRAEASMLAQEGLEISYNIFTNASDWTVLLNYLKTDTVFHVTSDGTPELKPGSQIMEDIVREIRIEDVFRSPKTGEITSQEHADAQYDPDTVLVKSRVEWQGKAGKEHIEYVTYITRGEQQ